MKNTHGGVLLLVKLHVNSSTLLKVTLLQGLLSRFLNCTNGTKLRKASQILGHLLNNDQCSPDMETSQLI